MKKRICIVEDDGDIRDLISYILMDDNYDVLMCSNVKEFANTTKDSLPDVVVFDIMLPDGSGLDLCREMNVRDSRVPVLLMSAHYRSEEAMAAGCASAFISKPFDIDYFKDTVTGYLIDRPQP